VPIGTMSVLIAPTGAGRQCFKTQICILI